MAPDAEMILTFGGDTQAILRYPAIEVADPDWTMENFSLGQYGAEIAVRVVAVGWYESSLLPDGSSFETFQRALRRYARAIIETLVQPHAFGGGVVVERIEGSYRTNPETGERDEWTAGSFIRFTLGGVEIRPTI